MDFSYILHYLMEVDEAERKKYLKRVQLGENCEDIVEYIKTKLGALKDGQVWSEESIAAMLSHIAVLERLDNADRGAHNCCATTH